MGSVASGRFGSSSVLADFGLESSERRPREAIGASQIVGESMIGPAMLSTKLCPAFGPISCSQTFGRRVVLATLALWAESKMGDSDSACYGNWSSRVMGKPYKKFHGAVYNCTPAT